MLRKILMSTVVLFGAMGVASAADLANTKSPPAYIPPPPLFSWTGLYAGAQMGYMWGSGSAIGYGMYGAVGGAHIGYNYQMNEFVVGLEGDINGASYSGSTAFFGTRENIDGSIRGRFGVAWDRALLYVTGGAAFAGIDNFYGLSNIEASHSRVGWTLGGGIQYAFTDNWSLGVEYRYTDYGTYYDFPFSPVTPFYNHDRDNRILGTVSYKFDMFAPPGPVVAKY